MKIRDPGNASSRTSCRKNYRKKWKQNRDPGNASTKKEREWNELMKWSQKNGVRQQSNISGMSL